MAHSRERLDDDWVTELDEPTVSEMLAAKEQEAKQLKEQLEEFKRKAAEKETQLGQTTGSFKISMEAFTDSETKRVANEQKAAQLQTALTDSETKRLASEQKVEQLQKNLTDSETKRVASEQKSDQLQKNLDESKRLNIELASSQHAAIAGAEAALNHFQNSFEEEQERSRAHTDNLRRLVTETGEELSKTKTNLSAAEERARNAEYKLAIIQSKLAAAEKTIANHVPPSLREAQLKNNNTQLTEKINFLQDELIAMTAQHRALVTVTKERERQRNQSTVWEEQARKRNATLAATTTATRIIDPDHENKERLPSSFSLSPGQG